ncbi:hypothetical protein GOP47_0013090 [Adiantum capillus-veneris]|uniref:Uncharacterized protein n=1 Tax=Adiantum capillus-veneris TaxID=13818 RepID=A0A9D4ZF03_ADICA|nr:hypothetical protein GOP47_0013090 [Adiantum capillus-veneris]
MLLYQGLIATKEHKSSSEVSRYLQRAAFDIHILAVECHANIPPKTPYHKLHSTCIQHPLSCSQPVISTFDPVTCDSKKHLQFRREYSIPMYPSPGCIKYLLNVLVICLQTTMPGLLALP